MRCKGTAFSTTDKIFFMIFSQMADYSQLILNFGA